ncbi:AsmA family protein [Variovorax saccharolyticus]|uniref:AsmA family protein n=1 Tax=Variovorax saccharolyticus TaxID=3053516 RepID=UPI002578AA3B|nr:AsmA family protein [Variovorax sp. J22R187]MDM0020995.1 AsmA family protein [Variovorax sp. J22R187]
METQPLRDGPGRAWRLASRALIALCLLALLLAAAWYALRRAYPPERLAAMLAESVSAATGRAFRIDGDLTLHLLPNVTIAANDVALANAEWGAEPDMLRARHVGFDISLRDLLSGTVRIQSVDIEGAELRLESDGAGRYNWRMAPSGGGSTGRAAPRITLDRLQATDTRISYRQGREGTRLELEIESLVAAAADEHSQLNARLALQSQRWTLNGQTGPLDALLAGTATWPLDLRASTDGASAALKGSMGTGPHAGSLDAEVSLKVDEAKALALLGEAAALVPLPLDWHTTLVHSPGQWRADAMQLSLAGQRLTGSATLRAGAGAPLKFEASLAAAAWRVEHLPALSAIQVRVAFEPGRLQFDPLSFAIAGGQARGQVHVALRPDAAPRVDLQLSARSMAVDALEDAQGGNRYFKGGRANLDARLAMTGRTPWALAGTATGEALLTARDVGLTGRAASLDRKLVARLIDALIPTGQPRENLAVQCAVVRLPLRDGVAAIDRSIAIETRQIAVSASGEINLARRTLSLAFRPQVKRGLDLNPGSLVELMLLQGPLEAPELSVNPRGAARQAANVGVAAATGGISLLAPMLRSAAGEASACSQAEHKGTATPSKTGKQEPERRLLPWPKAR